MSRCFACALAALFLAAGHAGATWSIILVDTRTKEIAIGSATCLSGFDLRQGAAVVRVGLGAAAAQSLVDQTGANRRLIFTELGKRTDPARILQLLARQDPQHAFRQYGIVDTLGRKVGFTGKSTFPFAGHLTGSFGTIHYAIQGNILTGLPVLLKAEEAIRTTPGDLAAKLMAGMQAARAMGGDGRCSCPFGPTACGSPPRQGFLKSAHIAYMIVARQGDRDGGCDVLQGCASGRYYLNLNVAFQLPSRPDPVLQLQTLFTLWRLRWVGRPDHHLSTVFFTPPTLPADGASRTTATVVLRDWQGLRLRKGGAKVTVLLDPTSPAQAFPGPVTDRGDGTYTFPVRAGTLPGQARFLVVVDDGQGPVLLSPRAVLPLARASLTARPARIGAAQGGAVTFTLQAGSPYAHRSYQLLASASGSSPGVPAGRLRLPLNPDLVTYLVYAVGNLGPFQSFRGRLDGAGAATARLAAPPGLLAPLKGQALTFAFGLVNPVDFVSNPVTVTVDP